MDNPFKYTNSNKRYHTLDYYYKNKFNSKVVKISLNAGFTCPNIDGKVGTGGCIYCLNGSGERATPLLEQFNNVKKIMNNKWHGLYIGYFQAHTNTYAPVAELKEKYETILRQENVIGLSIATRADAISDECLEYLKALNERTFLTIELGLQTIHDKTAKLINRCHTLVCFHDLVAKLRANNINVVVHIINGLPYETKEMMLETIKYINKLDIQGLKIHMLHILKGTKAEVMYKKEKFPLLTESEYTDIVCSQLEELNPEIVIHRLTGDPKETDLIEPNWTRKKINVLNAIDKELAMRNTYQGFNKTILNYVKREIDMSVKANDIVVDATIGNGNDTLYLCGKVNKGKVFGFDIQTQAINETKKKLTNYNNYELFNVGHENMALTLPNYLNKISLVIFNLGYLPNGNKEITTKVTTTIKAIKASLALLNDKGIILITIYPHEEGKREKQAILHFVKEKNIAYTIFKNTDNVNAPELIKINK